MWRGEALYLEETEQEDPSVGANRAARSAGAAPGVGLCSHGGGSSLICRRRARAACKGETQIGKRVWE